MDWGRPAVIGLALIVASAGAYGTAIESQPYVERSGGGAVQAAMIIATPLPSALSSRFARERMLLDCEDLVLGRKIAEVPLTLQSPLARACETRADAIVRAVPGYSYGWVLLSQMRERNGDRDGMVAALRQSYQTAPSLLWVAVKRFRVAERQNPPVYDVLGAQMDADVRLMAQSYAGVTFLARRYVDEKGFRERVTRIVEELDAEEQSRFLANVRRAAGAV